jgi:hypothetical protein
LSSLDFANVDLFYAATDAEDLGFGFSKQQRPGLTDDWWLDLVATNRSSSHRVNWRHSSIDWLWAFEKFADD